MSTFSRQQRSRRHGPFITSGFFSPSCTVPFDPFVDGFSTIGELGFDPGSGITSLAGVLRSFVDLDASVNSF